MRPTFIKPRYVARALMVVGTLVALGACPKMISEPDYTLSLAPSATSLFVGDSTRLVATLRDGSGTVIPTTFTWTVDNASVALVDSTGLVRGVGPGSAAVHVTARGQTASASLQVAHDDGQTLTVSPTAANILVDGTQRFTATLKDRNGTTIPSTPIWSTSSSAVATVDNTGLVRGVGAGSATIQAKVGTLIAGAAVNVAVRGNGVVFVGAGDIASCGSSGDEQTASLLDNISGTVFTLGDNAYDNGTAAEYTNCYGPSWGRHKGRTHPAPGNHDYQTAGASGYFGYFGAAAGDPSKGYYSYELGGWHIVVINSNIATAAGSVQEQWLRSDLRDHPSLCTLAYWHHPRFSSGAQHGNDDSMQPIWQALYDAGAELILSGHDHIYERFAPQTATGQLDAAKGIREFVVGTGGAGLYDIGTIKPNSEVRNNLTRGVLKLTLYADRYEFQFVHVAGASFTDSGSGSCH